MRGMYVYPWDLEEEGVTTILPRLRDIGIDAVSLAVSYHAGKFVRPHAPGRRVYFPEDGTIYFTPDLGRYGRIKPRLNSRVGHYNALRELAQHGADFRVTAWTVGLHNTPLGLEHPTLVAQNCFGDPLWNSLCPSHADVRTYLVALCADLGANHPVHEIAIETPGWQAYRHGHHHEFELIDLTPRAQIMLGMCFCQACLAAASAAGIDGQALRNRTRAELDLFFAEGTEPATDPATDADWQAFNAVRAGTVTSLVAEIRASMPAAIDLAVIPTTQSPNSLCWIEGSDLKALAKICRLEVPAYQTGVAAILTDVHQVKDAAGSAAKIGYILRPTHPNLSSAADVRNAVVGLAACGADRISFYNYGHLRLSSLDWIAAALT